MAKMKWKGSQVFVRIGDLGYGVVLTNQQMEDLVTTIKTKKPTGTYAINKSPGMYVKSFYSDKEILDFYNKNKPKVKRTPLNSGKWKRMKLAQPTIRFKKPKVKRTARNMPKVKRTSYNHK